MKRAVIIALALIAALVRPSMLASWKQRVSAPNIGPLQTNSATANGITVTLVSPTTVTNIGTNLTPFTASYSAGTATPGASIQRIDYYLDGVLVSSTTNAPLAPAGLASAPGPRNGKLAFVTLSWPPYAPYPGGSNLVFTVYKSVSLGTVGSPWKPTAYVAGARTNASVAAVAGQLYYFRVTATVAPFGESPPSNVVTNQL